MADPPPRIEAPNLRTSRRARVAGASAVVLIHLLPIAMLSRCDEAAREEPAALPPLQVALHDGPAPAGAPARFDIRPSVPRVEIAPPELQIQAGPEPVPGPTPTPEPAPSLPTDSAAASSSASGSASTTQRVASARDCWPYRWLLRMSRTIDSALRYPTEARRRGQRGTAFVRVTLERSGQVLEAPLIRSSGHPPLDAEARAVIQRIGRFEPLATGDCIGYDVIVVDQPVRFGR